jgi:hypothetical protein
MSSPAVKTPGSVQRETAAADLESQSQELQQKDIAAIAYALWQNRGCPEGSQDQDWIEAESTLKSK